MKTSLIKILAVIGMLVLVLSGCGKPNNGLIEKPKGSMEAAVSSNLKSKDEKSSEVTLIDTLGREVVIKQKPTRVVCLSPAATEIVAELGGIDVIAGRTDYCDYPKEVSEVTAVGSMTEPSVETIVGLKPDLVISTTNLNEQTLRKLDELKIPNVLIYEKESMEGTYNAIEKIGEVLYEKEKAVKLVATMKQETAEIVDKLKNVSEKPRVYYMFGFGESGDFTAGGNTFIHEIIELAGGENVAKDNKGWSYSLEKLVSDNPEVIVAADYIEDLDVLREMPIYRELKAVKEGKVYKIDEDIISRQGPRIVEGLKLMAEIIHPEIEY